MSATLYPIDMQILGHRLYVAIPEEETDHKFRVVRVEQTLYRILESAGLMHISPLKRKARRPA